LKDDFFEADDRPEVPDLLHAADVVIVEVNSGEMWCTLSILDDGRKVLQACDSIVAKDEPAKRTYHAVEALDLRDLVAAQVQVPDVLQHRELPNFR